MLRSNPERPWNIAEMPPRWLAGLMTVCLYILTAVFFTLQLLSTQLLPMKYMVPLALALEAVGLGVSWLVGEERLPSQFNLGCVLAAALCLVMSQGLSYVGETMQTVRVITTVTPETTVVGIYVRADDDRDFAAGAGGYAYGVLNRLDRANTDQTVGSLKAEYGDKLKLAEYGGVAALYDGLMSKEVDAIILNRAYLGLLQDIEGYEDAESRLRQVQFTHIENTPAPRKRTKRQEEIPAQSQEGAAQEPERENRTFTVFLSGVDTYGELDDSSRSDVNILAVVNPDTRQVGLVFTPRDYYVPLSISDGVKDKLTHAGIYGVDVCMDTISMLYDVDVDYYFRVNFAGFVDIINALGGVEVNSDLDFSIDIYDFTAGPNYLDGRAALMFVRERKSFEDGDIQRGKNQLALLRALIKKAMSPDLLINYTSVLNALEGSFETSIPYDLLSALIREQLDKGGDWDIESYNVNGSTDFQVPYSLGEEAYVMQPDETTVEEAKALIQRIYAGEE